MAALATPDPEPSEVTDARTEKKAAQKARRKASKAAKRAEQGLDARSARFGARNENRAARFVEYLVKTFGVERLRREGVCDVAGGRGEVAARLAHCHDVPVLLVEPREDVDLQATVMKKVAPRLPARYRAHLVAAGRSERVDRRATVLRRYFPPPADDGDAWEKIDACGVWVGLHADGATEAIAAEACKRGKSFAVVPCCVFPSYFITRIVEGGTPVKTTEELVAYLLEKHAHATKTTINFEGKNVAVALDAGVRVAADPASIAAALVENRPLLLPGAAAAWRASREWVSEDGTLDVAAMTRLFGDASAPVALPDGARRETTVGAYLARHFDKHDGEARPYLKDWHLGDGDWYDAPRGLDDDWLGACFEARRDDFSFCYVGAAGTRTPVHADVLASYSWSGNVVGEKTWWLFPPAETGKLKNAGGDLVDDCRPGFYDAAAFPELARARRLAVTQRAGDVLFVPSDWHHMVLNTADTVSINRNWCNACAVDRVWAHVADEADRARAELDDCAEDVAARYGGAPAWRREWCWMVERVLRDAARLNVSDFVAMVHREVGRPLAPAPAFEARVRAKVRAALVDARDRYGDQLFHDGAGAWPADEDDASWGGDAAAAARARLDAALAALDDERGT